MEVLNEADRSTTFYEESELRNVRAKFAVAFRAVLFLGDGDSLLIDAGTSLTPIAKIIQAFAERYSSKSHFTIMTHNRGAFDSLTSTSTDARLNIFQTGGRYDKDLNASFGHQAQAAYEDFHPKWVFLGQSGLNSDIGLFCHGNTEELSLKQVIFSKPAYARVILADYTKIGIPGGLCFGTSDRLTDNVEHCLLITNNPLHAMKEGEKDGGDDQELDNYRQRFEEQTTILSTTYGIKVIDTDYEWTDLTDGRGKIRLAETDKPDKGLKWMAVEGENYIVLKEVDGDWTVEDVHVSRLEKLKSMPQKE